jgi:hypothetical protein
MDCLLMSLEEEMEVFKICRTTHTGAKCRIVRDIGFMPSRVKWMRLFSLRLTSQDPEIQELRIPGMSRE